MAHLELRQLAKSYGRVAALDDVSLTVRDGELLVLLGPSGSGKSTILKLIAGIEAPTAGEIWLAGRRIDPLLPRLRNVAMVFQSYALYPHMSVASNLAFPLESYGMPRAQIHERVEETSRLLGLEALLSRRPGQLSGGQQQRVALGRAIVRRPQLFLMDEPLSNLDAQLRVKTRLDLLALHERLEATTLYVTHDQAEAMSMGHRIALLHAGRLQQVGAPEEVYEWPADVTIAGFLGSPAMNLLRARCEAAPSMLRLTGPGFDIHVPRHDGGAGGADLPREVTMGVRPQYLIVDLAEGCMEARLRRIELLGHERLVHLTVGEADVVAFAPLGFRASPGDPLRLGVRADGVRLFAVTSGVSIARPMLSSASAPLPA